MRVLRIASFVGNIGDLFSHSGQEYVLREIFGSQIEYTDVEVRRSYSNYKGADKFRFDSEFAAYASKFDLVQIGGGNFLEPFKDSPLGVRLPLSWEFLSEVSAPMIFTSMGLTPWGDSREGPTQVFRELMVRLSSIPNLSIALRNDGSRDWLKTSSDLKINAIPEVLDSGFFVYESGLLRSSRQRILQTKSNPYFIVNLAEDQLRSSAAGSEAEYQLRCVEISRLIHELAEREGLDIVFTPHIPQDLTAISNVIQLLPDFFRRERVGICQFSADTIGAEIALSAYEGAKFTVGMRFHANIASLSLGVPCLPLVALNRLDFMLESVGHEGPKIDLRRGEEATVSDIGRASASDFIRFVERWSPLDLGEAKKITLHQYRKFIDCA